MPEAQQQAVAKYSNIAMQRMKGYTASTGIEYGAGKQVIEVDSHSGQHHEIHPLPPVPVKPKGYKDREHQMKEIVNDCLHFL